MMMKRTLISATAMLLLCAGVTACSPTPSTTTPTSTTGDAMKDKSGDAMKEKNGNAMKDKSGDAMKKGESK